MTPDARPGRRLVEAWPAGASPAARDAGHRYLPALLALSAHRRGWVRPLDAWQIPAGPAADQFADLARHLLAHHEVPRWLDGAWMAGRTPEGVICQGWFEWVGLGRNLRTAGGLPLALTRAMAHPAMRAPAELGVPEALRFGQVVAMGGDERLARAVVATRLGAEFDHPEFWASVIRWLVAHLEVEPGEVGPIVDFFRD